MRQLRFQLSMPKVDVAESMKKKKKTATSGVLKTSMRSRKKFCACLVTQCHQQNTGHHTLVVNSINLEKHLKFVKRLKF